MDMNDHIVMGHTVPTFSWIRAVGPDLLKVVSCRTIKYILQVANFEND